MYPRSYRTEPSASNSVLFHLGSPNQASMTVYNGTQKRLNAEPHGVAEALDRSFRHQIQFSIGWARQITILRHSTMEHKHGRIRSHRASQKLSIGGFSIKPKSLSPNPVSMTFYNGGQKRPNTERQGVPETVDRSVRHEIQFSIVWARQRTLRRFIYHTTQKRLKTEPQGVREALDRSLRHEIQFSIVWVRQSRFLDKLDF